MEEEENTQPCKPPILLTNSQAVMEELTDPNLIATQIVMDPRRLGQGNSGLSNEDLADVFCIIHPISSPALQAAALAHKTNPKNTLSVESDVKIYEKNGAPLTTGSIDLASQGLVACDIALRFSAELKDLGSGFAFGRNPQRCDFVLGANDEVKRVSNIHFRIYINEIGVIMLEDQSTNGTAVNGILLRAKDKENGQNYRHTLEQGNSIVLAMTPPARDFKFIVRIPNRNNNEAAEELFEANFRNFMTRVRKFNLDKMARNPLANGQQLNLFPDPSAALPAPSLSALGSSKEWRGGNKYNKVSTVGRGAFATVYMITDKYDGSPYAAKELEKRRFMKNGVLDQKIDMEMKIMRRIDHPNIVRFVEHIDWKDYIYIIMEFVPAGDLGSLVNKQGPLPESIVNTMAIQLVSALKYLHDNGITHRDVKPDNILIQNLDPFHVKLTDFGLSKMIDTEDTFLRTFCGTLLYCAPEVYTEYREYDFAGNRNRRLDTRTLPPQRYGHAVDIWSTAGVLFFALCKMPPYPVKSGTNYHELLHQIMTQPLNIKPLEDVPISEDGIRCVKSMLHTRPEHRATVEQLRRCSWITGRVSKDAMIDFAADETSQDEEGVEEDPMIVDENIDPALEQGASQLSITNGPEVGDSTDNAFDDISDITEMQPLEVPSSVNSNDEASANEESFVFMRPPVPNKAGNGRLFGEVNISAMGSSGAIPEGQLNLPSQNVNFNKVNNDTSQQMASTQAKEVRAHNEEPSKQSTTKKSTMPPPPLPPSVMATVPTIETDDRNVRSSSLMGAESLVGHLNMRSPADTPSPGFTGDLPTTSESRENTGSLRRKREEIEDYRSLLPDIDGQDWVPDDLPPKKKSKSSRVLDYMIPKTLHWPREGADHWHYDYPGMNHSDYVRLRDYVEERGEKFEVGNKIFDDMMQKYRNSRNPSLEPDLVDRVMHKDNFEEIRSKYLARQQQLAERERQRSEQMTNTERIASTASADVYDAMNPVVSTEVSSPAVVTSPVDSPITIPTPEPVVGNDFQPPKRILAKLVATPESCLPTIAINVTDVITSWGRAPGNTNRYIHLDELRISKYNFKIFVFKPGYFTRPDATVPIHHSQPWKNADGSDQDLACYISTKASLGIIVNGNVPVPAHDKQNAHTASQYWGELHNGDIITCYDNKNNKAPEFVQFKFECFWGASKDKRRPGERFEILDDADMISELDEYCLKAETGFFEEKTAKDEEERRQEELSLAREEERQTPLNFHQSFNGVPPTG